MTETVHASAVLAGASAVLIRGPAGSGKSRLALALIGAAKSGLVSFARLVGDDRVVLAAANGRLVVRPAPALAGLIEVRGLGIRSLDHEPLALVGLVVDLGEPGAKRLPGPGQDQVTIEGIILPRLAFRPGAEPMPTVLAALLTAEAQV